MGGGIRSGDLFKGPMPLAGESSRRSSKLLGSHPGAGGVGLRAQGQVWVLPGPERVVPWVTSCSMNGKGHVTGVASFPVLIGCYCWQFDDFLLNLEAVST